jgi:hypothetical protein
MRVLIFQFFTCLCSLPDLETYSSRLALASALTALLITLSILADDSESIPGITWEHVGKLPERQRRAPQTSARR